MQFDFRQFTQKPLVRIIAGYLMLGWIIMQVLDIFVPALQLPDWIETGTILILLCLFPIVLIVSWALLYAKKDSPGFGEKGSFKHLDKVLFGAVLAVLGITSLNFFLGPDRESAPGTPSQEVAVVQDVTETTTSTVASENDQRERSIAVLPFADLSEAQDQGYYAAGVAEEILNALFRLDGLRVAGRTASFSLSTSADNPNLVGNALGVAHILTGSVRKQGDTERITVQLVEVATGFALWSETFEGSSENIFEVQETIARAVADELQVVLNLAPGKKLIEEKTANKKAYDLYLKARNAQVNRFGSNLPDAIRAYKEAIALDPEFAQAWAGLGEAYAHLPTYNPVNIAESWSLAEKHANKAISIDPNNALAYSVLGLIYCQRRQFLKMQEAFDKALSLDPKNIETIHYNAVGILTAGRLRDAAPEYERIVRLDPKLHYGHMGLAYLKMVEGKFDEAEINARRVLMLGHIQGNWPLGEIAGLRGELDNAQRLVGPILKLGLVSDFNEDEVDILLAGIFGDDTAKQTALDLIADYRARSTDELEDMLPYFLIRLGDYPQAFEVLMSYDSVWNEISFGTIWSQYGEGARQHPAFQDFVRDVGLVEYWEKYGWADGCRMDETQQVVCS